MEVDNMCNSFGKRLVKRKSVKIKEEEFKLRSEKILNECNNFSKQVYGIPYENLDTKIKNDIYFKVALN